MGMRFRNTVKIFPGLRLNISKSGLSVSLGAPGATVNLGGHGTTSTFGLPGTGLSYSFYSPRSSSSTPDGSEHAPAPDHGGSHTLSPARKIESADTEDLTSASLADILDIIDKATRQHEEIRAAIKRNAKEHRAKIRWLWWKNTFLGGLLFWLDKVKLEAEIRDRADEGEKLKEALELSLVDVSFNLDDETRAQFNQLDAAFEALTSCEMLWDIVEERDVDRAKERSSAALAVSRKRVFLSRGTYEAIKQTNVPQLGNANGGQILIFPAFILVRSGQEIALVDYADLQVKFGSVRFTETQTVPSDSQVVGQTWAKANANGSRDKRFKDNYQIPVAQYGDLELRNSNGLHEEWMFSNFQLAQVFAEALEKWQALVASPKVDGKRSRRAIKQ